MMATVKQLKLIDVDFSIVSVVVNIRIAGKWMFISHSYRKNIYFVLSPD